MVRRIPLLSLAALALVALGACTTLEEEMRPEVDSLHTEEMEAAIRSAQSSKPPEPPPKQPM